MGKSVCACSATGREICCPVHGHGGIPLLLELEREAGWRHVGRGGRDIRSAGKDRRQLEEFERVERVIRHVGQVVWVDEWCRRWAGVIVVGALGIEVVGAGRAR